jgi:hypothetical protein
LPYFGPLKPGRHFSRGFILLDFSGSIFRATLYL